MLSMEDNIILYVPNKQLDIAEEFFCNISCKIGLDQILPMIPKSHEDHEYLILKNTTKHKNENEIKEYKCNYDDDLIIRRRHLRKLGYKFKSLYKSEEEEEKTNLKIKYYGISKNQKYKIKDKKEISVLEAIVIPNNKEFIINALKEIKKIKIEIYNGKRLEMIAAVVSIQSAFRAYLNRKENKINERIMEYRACIIIQRYWKQMRFYSRMKLLIEMKKITSYLRKTQLVPIMFINIKDYEFISKLKINDNFIIPNQKLELGYKDGNLIIIKNDDFRWPQWLKLNIEINDNGKINDVLDLIAQNSKIQWTMDKKYLSITFKSVEECVKRNVMLLALTWNKLKKTGIKMMTLLEMKKIEKSNHHQIKNEKLNIKDFINLNIKPNNEISNNKKENLIMSSEMEEKAFCCSVKYDIKLINKFLGKVRRILKKRSQEKIALFKQMIMMENMVKISKIKNYSSYSHHKKRNIKLLYKKLNNIEKIIKLNNIIQLKEKQDQVKREHQRRNEARYRIFQYRQKKILKKIIQPTVTKSHKENLI